MKVFRGFPWSQSRCWVGTNIPRCSALVRYSPPNGNFKRFTLMQPFKLRFRFKINLNVAPQRHKVNTSIIPAKCFTPTRRTSGHCLGTFKTEDKFFSLPPTSLSPSLFLVTAVKSNITGIVFDHEAVWRSSCSCILTVAVVAGELSASCPGERSPGKHWIGRFVGLRASLDDVESRKCYTFQDSHPDPSVVKLVTRHCTDCSETCKVKPKAVPVTCLRGL
jgi:hypothetical protein